MVSIGKGACRDANCLAGERFKGAMMEGARNRDGEKSFRSEHGFISLEGAVLLWHESDPCMRLEDSRNPTVARFEGVKSVLLSQPKFPAVFHYAYNTDPFLIQDRLAKL
jgi:hypothetical protein